MSNGIMILGGGPAGLAAAWRLEELGRDYRVLEAAPTHGGNARTLVFGDYRYDTGPHRFHDRDPRATKRIVDLLGPQLHEVSAPSRILWNGRFVDFPLRPAQALAAGRLGHTLRATRDFLGARVRRPPPGPDFAAWACGRFGRTLADTFLIPFSEKLWGLPADRLSPEIAGRRLPGFSIGGLVREMLGGRRSDHMEGRFLYPRGGYGRIVDSIAASLGPGRIEYNARIRRVEARGRRIVGVACEGDSAVRPVAQVINTLPVTLLVKMLDPPAPAPVLEAAGQLRFRDLVLVVLVLDQPSVSEAACTYFPGRALEFTRAHEPRNRCGSMSPPGKTSLVVEFPCFEGDAVWTRDDARLVTRLVGELEEVGLVARSRVAGSRVTRLRRAYPVYSVDYREHLATILDHVEGFENLESIGRGGAFFYGHVHDFVSAGADAAEAVDRRVATGA